jgi:CubicO group peptidase (beta-lactamase class C family)
LHQVDSVRIALLSQQIRRGDFGAIHSLLIARHGQLLVDEYYRGYNAGQLHTLQSVTKSVTSLLVGLAIADGLIASVDQPLETLVPPAYREPFRADPRKRAIRLRDVLSMTPGLDWDEANPPYSDSSNVVRLMNRTEDWPAFVLNRPMAHTPGTRFFYNSGSSILLSLILQHATGMRAHWYAERRLFDPLGITPYAWNRHRTHPDHLTHTGGGLYLRPRDLAKIGQLLVDGGRWKGAQVVPDAWIEESTKRRVDRDSVGGAYGYQWWLRFPSAQAPAHRHAAGRVVYAAGYGGQFVFAVPALSLVVVVTGQDLARNQEEGDQMFTAVFEDGVLPAIIP